MFLFQSTVNSYWLKALEKMEIVETKESIKRRLQSEAARQWGVDESELRNGSFDPLIDLLFGAFSVESEKIWQEMEISRSRIVSRMVENILPEALTGIIPAHAVAMIKPVSGNSDILQTDHFYTSGNDPVHMTAAGSFHLSGSSIQIIATGNRIDKINNSSQRESLVKLSQNNAVTPNTCWLGIDLPENSNLDTLPLFFNWPETQDRVKYLPYISAISFSGDNPKPASSQTFRFKSQNGIEFLYRKESQNNFFDGYEENVRNYYKPYFITISGFGNNVSKKRYPEEWNEQLLDQSTKATLSQELYWIKLICPAAIPAEALNRLEIISNCVPVINRKLIHQRGRLQPLFNVFGLADDAGFLEIERVLNGDGEILTSVDQKEISERQNVYALRKKNVARYDHRDAFESLVDVTAKIRDDLAAFEAMDNSILTNHLDIINRSISKINEHLETIDYKVPQIYVLVKTKSAGTILDVYFWTSLGSKANGISAFSKLNQESSNSFKSSAALLISPSVAGRDVMDETQKQKAFKESILTRGRAVTVEDFRTIALNHLGKSALEVEVKKGFKIGQTSEVGLLKVLEINILPEPSLKENEEWWLKQAQLLKNSLEQRSTGVLPLVISVEGFNWRL